MPMRTALTPVVAGLLLLGATAQAPGAQETARWSPPAVTAAIGAEQVRFVAPNSVYQMRLEVFGSDGVKVFDSDFAIGNVLDWGSATSRPTP